MALRCVYTDLDGTLLGAGASLFRTAEGEFTLLPARALEACHRAGVELMLMSGRRRSQVAEPARIVGASSYCFEIGGGLVIDGEEQWLCGEYSPRDGCTPWELIEESGAPALLLDRFAGALEPHTPWHTGREISHLYRGDVDVAAANGLLDDGLRLVDNGILEEDPSRHCYHLVPAAASKAAAVERHMRARAYAPGECIAVGDSQEDLEVAPLVGRCFVVANAPSGLGGERTEGANGEGFYEAVVRALAEAR